ncbi:hypothetical protein XELAEV_18012895mg [Xenopus laevis]|uniref:Uncharacterized protein n=1 Tax=Xenopus laevis TaxID=8355 RepID=A0A974HYV4_XENLA|nr:hypothetical protein XELAEV_18012895mg [Xenopus laevis]
MCYKNTPVLICKAESVSLWLYIGAFNDGYIFVSTIQLSSLIKRSIVYKMCLYVYKSASILVLCVILFMYEK